MATRQAAITERRRNVLVDAGAGTGKTSLVVERFVDMVAPAGGAAPVPIERLAAITFTRNTANAGGSSAVINIPALNFRKTFIADRKR